MYTLSPSSTVVSIATISGTQYLSEHPDDTWHRERERCQDPLEAGLARDRDLDQAETEALVRKTV
jgi:hypothetical protein